MKLHKWPGLLIWIVILAGIASAGVWILIPRTASQASNGPETREGMILPTGVVSETSLSPAISFIDSSTPTCARPAAGTNVCYVDWSYMSVIATPGQYMISMTVMINDRLRAYHQGFFQNAIYVPSDLMGMGFRVPCGTPGASGIPNMGNTYAYVIRAMETGGLKAANYGSVTCPADIVSIADLSLLGPTSGRAGISYSFNAAVLPITTTLPITYTWTATGQPKSVVAAGTNSSASFAWTTDGTKTVSVSAVNMNSTISDTLTVTILTRFNLFLPLTRR
jgi:hypothetical protein